MGPFPSPRAEESGLGGGSRSRGPQAGPARRDGNIFPLAGTATPRPRRASSGNMDLYCWRAAMRAIILGTLAAGLAAATAAGGDAKQDTERLQGSWSVTHMEESGK